MLWDGFHDSEEHLSIVQASIFGRKYRKLDISFLLLGK